MTTQTTAYNLSTVTFTQSTDRPHIIIIEAMDEYYTSKRIGSFNFYTKSGHLTLLNGKRKDFKQFKSLMNVFFKYDEMFGWTPATIDNAQMAATQMIKEEKQEANKAHKDLNTNKATEYLNKLIKKDKATIESLSFLENKTDEEIITIINTTFKRAITKKLANEILNAIKVAMVIETVEAVVTSEVTEGSTVQEDNQADTNTTKTEVFHLYSNTFPTYSDAFNHAIKNSITTTMILSSKHPTMTNERLKHLESEYVFSKQRMSYEDMKEYYSYLSELPSSLDQEERYYKLKSFIQRYEYKQESIKQLEDENNRISVEGSRLLLFMKEKGLELEYSEGSSGYQRYYYKGEKVYSFFSGLSTQQFLNDMQNLFNKYFAEYKNEYDMSSVHYYQGSTNTTIDSDNYPYGWISYNNNTKIAAFNRPLSDQELSAYGLMNSAKIYQHKH